MTINRKTAVASKANSVSAVRQTPAAPPAYRPQPLPKVLQKKPNPASPVNHAAKNQALLKAPTKVGTPAGSSSPVIQRAPLALGLLAAVGVGGAIIYGIANCLRGGRGQQQLPPPPLTPINATSRTTPTSTTVTRPQHQAVHVSPTPSSPLLSGPPSSSASSSMGGPPPSSSSSSSSSGMPPRVSIEDMLAENNRQRNNNYLGLLSDSRRRRTPTTTTTTGNNNNVVDDDDDDDGGGSRTGFRAPKKFSGKSDKKYKKGQKGGVSCYLNHSKHAIEQGSNSNYLQHAERLAIAQALSKGSTNIHLEQNAWPCEYCHPWLQNAAKQKGITITVQVTDDHGGYASFHGRAPDSTGTIVYHPDGRVVYQ